MSPLKTEFYTHNFQNFYVRVNSSHLGRYSPVRRASEGSKCQPLIHGPLQECQQLIQQQKLAHRNLSSTQIAPDNSSSLPG